MAPGRDTSQMAIAGKEEALTSGQIARKQAQYLGWRRTLSLRTRLVLLVMASVVPVLGMAAAREYFEFQTQRENIYDGLLTVARGTGVSVERELQLRISALETLATSPALQDGNLAQFDVQAERFLGHQPPDTLLGLASPELTRLRMYGLPPGAASPLPYRDSSFMGTHVFITGRPGVTNLHVGHATGRLGFSVDVPVFRDGKVAYDLFMRLLPDVMADLVARQHLPPRTVLTVIDGTGTVVARVPNMDRFVGSHIVRDLWDAVRSNDEGIVKAPTLEGIPAVAAFVHVTPSGWGVVVGAPEDVVLAPMYRAMIQVAATSAVILAAGLILAIFAARSITRPISQLRHLAMDDDRTDRVTLALTGLPETDTVAQALLTAAAERHAAVRDLAESEARFRALFERSPSGTILLDPESTQVIDCNEVAASYVGLTANGFRGRKITEFALETSHERIHAICRSVVAGQTTSYETRIKGLNGPRDLLIAVAPVVLRGRTLVLLNQIDFTQLRHAEADLRINEERLELARQGANLGIWDWNLASDTLNWSEQQWHLHGLDPRPGGPSPELWRKTVHSDDLHRAQQELIAALKSPDHPYSTEYSVILADGSRRRLLGRGQAIRGTDGRVIRMVGINMDVTARYEAELARDQLIHMLETERNRLSEIVDALPVGVRIVDAKGCVILGNQVMQRLNDPLIQPGPGPGHGQWMAYDLDGTRLATEDFPVQRALRLGETTLPGDEFLFRDPDGKDTWFRVASIPLHRVDGQVQEALAIFQDIDAEKRLLEMQQLINARLEQRVHEEMMAREAAQQRAAHAERMHALGQIAGGIAHDFNNVLQAVAGGAALIERRPQDTERVLRNARMVLDAARRGAAITSRLLAFSRRGDLRAEAVDSGALLTDMAEVLTHTLGGSVVCAVDVAPGLPLLFADRGQLETVLVNLATNARDAMPQGGTLTLSANSEIVLAEVPHPAGLAAGGYIRITVSDTGSGMEDSVLSRVTEPFFTTKEPGKGTGLGLAMAKGFAEQSGGSLSIDSVVGQGTHIILWLPHATCDESVSPANIATISTDLDQPCVLLVDDDATVRDVLTLSLEDSGFTVISADSGAAALAHMASVERIDILVSDLTMPAMDGLTLIRTAQQRQPDLPAVLLTGYVGDGAMLAVGSAINGTFSLLRKPITGLQLVDRINALLTSRKQTDPV